jgi:hypothetical protein
MVASQRLEARKHMRVRRRIRIMIVVASLAASLALAEPATAWWESGHYLVANIAYDRVDAPTRAKVVDVLRKHPRLAEEFLARMPPDVRKAEDEVQARWIFLQASIWPDLIRGNAVHDRPTWHYITNPHFLSDLDRAALAKSLKYNGKLDLPAGLKDEDDPQELNAVQALQLVTTRLPKAATSAGRKAVYYCWLLHLVGDVHQPLHSTSLFSRGRFNGEGDRGGNKIPVKQVKNLHALWDSLPGNKLTLNEVRARAAKYLARVDAKQRGEKAAANLKFADWVQESHILAKQHVYSAQILQEIKNRDADPDQPLPPIDLPEAYLQNAGRIAENRIVEASYRLAELIKQAAK